MANFHISVINKVATNNEPDKTLVCGNGDHTLVFAFDSEWDADPAKTARFIYYRDGVLKYQDVVFTGNLVQAPMLSDISEVFVGVYTGNLRTTTPARIFCERSILCGGGVHEEPPEDVYQQILQLLSTTLQHTPKVSEHGTWVVYNAETGAYEDTGVRVGMYGDWDAVYFEQGYIRNRPFGVDYELEPVLRETACIPHENGKSFDIPLDFSLEIGKTYRVIYNGIMYRSTAKRWSHGETDFGGISDNVPFIILPPSEGERGFIHTDDSPTSVTLQIDVEGAEIVKPLDKKYLPDDIGAVKTVNGQEPDENGNVQVETSSQSDWNAAEGEPGHVLNRTHWEENSLVEVLPELKFTSYAGNGTTLKTPLGLTPGKTYIVNWNGAEYSCKAFTVSFTADNGDTYTSTVIGDYSISDTSATATGEPFCISEHDQAELIEAFAVAVYIKVRDDTIHDCIVSIYEETETIHKLAGKYLPNGVPYFEGGGEPVELLPPTKLEGEDGEFIVPADAGIVLVDGGTYVVNWNGTEYTCTAQFFEMNGESGIIMGNIGLAMGGEDTGEPFVILYAESLAAMGASLNVIGLDGAAEVTLGLTGSPPLKIHKLDNRCLDLAWLPTAKKVETEVMEETTFTADSDKNTPLNRSILPIGTNVTVIFDDVRYECTVTELSPPGWVTFGNLAINGADEAPNTGEPFLFYNLFESGPYAIQFADEGSHTVSVYVTESTINKIPSDFLPDGYPYIEPNGVLLEESEATSFTHPTFGTMWGIYKAVELKVGKTYTVIYNGTPYECVCQAAPAGLINDPDAVAMGNFAVVGGANTGEPFAMLISNAFEEVDIIDLSGAEYVTVGIMGEVYHKITPKFLPDDKTFTIVVKATISDSGVDIFSVSCSYKTAFAKAMEPNTFVQAKLLVYVNADAEEPFMFQSFYFGITGASYLYFFSAHNNTNDDSSMLTGVRFYEDGTIVTY